MLGRRLFAQVLIGGARVVQEPLVSVDPDGQLVPTLAAEVPSLQNGLWNVAFWYREG